MYASSCFVSLQQEKKMAKKTSPIKAATENNEEFIEVYGAREHNLKDINISIPKNKAINTPFVVAVFVLLK